MRHLGCFVSCAGGLYKSLENGQALGVNSIMLHPSPPQRWNTTPFAAEQILKFNELRPSTGIEKIFFHGIYLINLANPDKQKLHLAKVSLQNYMRLAEEVGADGVVFHVGSFRDLDPEECFPVITEAIDWVLERSPGNPKLMLEIAAGAGNVVGDTFAELKRIRDGVMDQERVQFCLDTAHLFGSGYDIRDHLDDVMVEMETVLGLENIGAVHFNDSKGALNSKKDRHENIGDGLIGEDAMKAFLNHPKLKHLPFVMETPALADIESSQGEVDKLKSWATDQ